MHILIVEDNAGIAEILKQYILLEFGSESKIAIDNASAIRSINSYRPKLILLDYLLQDGTCHGLINYCQSMAYPIPIIIVSAAGELARACAERYGLHYVPKPFNLDSFSKLIKNHL
jgi:response regulator of citrate/malate metabolism